MKIERHKKILSNIKRHGKVEVSELADKLDVSTMTIRRDLDFLESKGFLVRTRGGAISTDIINYEIPFQVKEVKNIDEKQRIGKKAAGLIKEGQTIFLDAGTTCLTLAYEIKLMNNITVITNDIRIALELYKNPDLELICLGGKVQPKVGAIIGNYAETMLDTLNVDISFVGTSAIDDNYVLSTPTMEKAFLKRKMIGYANKAVILADHSKYGKKSLYRICSLEDVDILITDQGVENEIIQELRRAVPQLLLV